MVGFREPLRSSSPGTGKVSLYVVGHRSLIPEPVTIRTRLSNTWLQLLNGELKLNVPADQGIYVCASNYHPTNPQDGKGWRAKLTDQITDFVRKFERKRKYYRVRLAYPIDGKKDHGVQCRRYPDPMMMASPKQRRAATPGPHGNRGQVSQLKKFPNAKVPLRKRRAFSCRRGIRNRTEGNDPNWIPRGEKRSRNISASPRPLSNSSARCPNIVITRVVAENGVSMGIPSVPGPHVFFLKEEEPGSALKMTRDPFALAGTQYDDEGEEEEDTPEIQEQEENQLELDGGGGDGTKGDAGKDHPDGEVDDLGGDDQVEEELRQLGIPDEDVKSISTRRFSAFSNAYMLRVRNEIQELLGNKMEWMDVFQRSPLAFYFMQEIFKE